MTLKLAQFCDDPKKISTKPSYPQKYTFFWKPQKIEIQNFEPPKNSPSLRMGENIRAPPPPPPPGSCQSVMVMKFSDGHLQTLYIPIRGALCLGSTRIAILSVFFNRVTLLKLITDCWFFTLLVLLFVLEILKKKFKEKKIFFLFFYYRLIIFRLKI